MGRAKTAHRWPPTHWKAGAGADEAGEAEEEEEEEVPGGVTRRRKVRRNSVVG